MRTRLGLLAGCGVLVAASAMAQTPAQTPSAPPRDREVTIGGVFTGPASMGSSDAVLLGPNGAPTLVLFGTESKLAFGIGPTFTLGFHLRPTLWLELTGTLVRASLTTQISNDFDGATAEVLATPVLRLSVEGGLAWYFRDRGDTAWFLRGGGGLMRETSGELALANNGFIGSAGLGLRHWWRTNGKGKYKRVGLRAEFRGEIQSGGISLGGRSVRIGPAGAVQFVFGY